jgi:hypothetical protein
MKLRPSEWAFTNDQASISSRWIFENKMQESRIKKKYSDILKRDFFLFDEKHNQ